MNDLSFSDIQQNRLQKKELLVQLLAMTKLEKEQMEADDPQALESTAVKWDALSKKVDILDKQYQMMAILLSDPKQKYDIERLEQENRQLIEEIDKVHRVVNALAKEKMQQYKADLKKVQLSNERLQSYINPYTSEDGLYFDKKN